MPVDKKLFANTLALVKETFAGFSNDKIMKKSASLAYYTIFSLAPLLLILMWTVGFFYGEDATSGEIFAEINELVGAKAAAQIQDIIRQISLSEKSGIAIVIGVGTLIIGSTTVFIEIQDSINAIWGVKAKPQKGWKKMLLDRFISFSMIIGLGFLLIVSLLVSTIVELLSGYLIQVLPDIMGPLFNLINFGITFLVISSLFAIIFKFLPDAQVKWKYVRSGAIFTALLFIAGKYLISLYMQFTAPESAYGAAGSIIIILLWVYYTAAILYLGAEFTKVYTKHQYGEILPSKFAVRVIQQEIEEDPHETTATRYPQSSKGSD